MAYKYIPFVETSQQDLKHRQLAAIKRHIKHASENSAFYRKKFTQENFDPDKFSSFEDLKNIIPISKEELRLHNSLFFASPEEEWCDVACTSGTTGSPVYIPVTQKDLKRMAVCGAQTLRLTGLDHRDKVHLTMPMSAWMWMAGFGFYMCFTAAGACVLRFGPGYEQKSIETMSQLKPTAVMGVPSYLIKLGKAAREAGVTKYIKRVFTIGENMLQKDLSKNAAGKKLTDLWDAPVYSCYGATEGPFLCVECEEEQGFHINPDELYVEILHRETLEPLPPGEEGLVAVTPLNVEAFPLIRYINGDISFLLPHLCPCGKMLQRLGPIIARRDQMIKVKGVMVYPDAIKNIIESIGDFPVFQIEANRRDFADEITVFIPQISSNKDHENGAALQKALKSHLGVTLKVEVIPAAQLMEKVMPADARKPITFADKR